LYIVAFFQRRRSSFENYWVDLIVGHYWFRSRIDLCWCFEKLGDRYHLLILAGTHIEVNEDLNVLNIEGGNYSIVGSCFSNSCLRAPITPEILLFLPFASHFPSDNQLISNILESINGWVIFELANILGVDWGKLLSRIL